MRTALSIIGVSAALVAATAFTGAASASSSGSAVHYGTPAGHVQIAAKKPCYSNAGADSGTGIASTDTDDPAGNSSIGAADFQIKKKHCTFNTVDATGVYAAGPGPADSFTITIYKNKRGLPGKVVNQQTVPPNSGDPHINVSVNPVKLKRGKYFVSVQASMDYNVKGGWFWETTTNQLGGIDLWENYGEGYGHCFTWDNLDNCFGLDSDYIVTLYKS